MAMPCKISTLVISVLTLTSLLFLILINFSAPLITALYFLRSSEAGGVRFGLWGWCLEQDGTCSPDLQLNYTWEPQISIPVTGALVFYPIAAISTLLALISILPLSHSPSVRSRNVFVMLALVSGLLSSVAFIFMIAIWGIAKKRFEDAGFTASFGPLPWLSMVAALSMNFVTSYASFESTALSAPKSRPFVELYKDKPDKTKDAEAEKIVPNKIAPHPRSTEKGAAKGDISKKSVSKDGVREKSTSGPAPAKKLATPGIPSMSRAVVPKISSDPTPVDNSTAQLENKGSTKSVHKKLIPSHGAAGVATAKRIASKTPTSRVAAIERAGEKISTETAALKRTSKRARPNNPPATALDIPTAAASHEKQFTPGMNSQRRSKRERHTLRPEP